MLTIAAKPSLGHERRGSSHQTHRREHVEFPLTLPVLLGQLLQRARSRRPRAVDQGVDSAELLLARGDDPVAGIGGGEVRDQRERSAA